MRYRSWCAVFSISSGDMQRMTVFGGSPSCWHTTPASSLGCALHVMKVVLITYCSRSLLTLGTLLFWGLHLHAVMPLYWRCAASSQYRIKLPSPIHLCFFHFNARNTHVEHFDKHFVNIQGRLKMYFQMAQNALSSFLRIACLPHCVDCMHISCCSLSQWLVLM